MGGSSGNQDNNRKASDTSMAAASGGPNGGREGMLAKTVTLKTSIASKDGYYFKSKEGKTIGPLGADKFEWYLLLVVVY